MNSIIQLEDQLHRQEMLKKRRQNGEAEIDGNQEMKPEEPADCSESIRLRRKKRGNKNEKPTTSSKMSELKKRIENLSRQSKKHHISATIEHNSTEQTSIAAMNL